MLLLLMIFKDILKIFVKSGKGGDGIRSKDRTFHIKGIPDGGDGGMGGSIWLYASKMYSHLGHLTKFHFKAEPGENGGDQCKTGANGKDIEIYVPHNTSVFIINPGGNKFLCTLNDQQRLCVAKGGRGGFGNKYYASSTNQIAEKFTLGKPAIERYIMLQMKLIADIGIIGAPNAGKSSTLRALTNSKTKVADYAFTTRIPHLGVSSQGFSLIDIPGLIEDASKGKGMGIQFLSHIEKCQALICVLDILDEPQKTYAMLVNELFEYNKDLISKIKLIILNKMDLIADLDFPIIDNNIEQICISTTSGYNIDLLHEKLSIIREQVN